jgi:hypothetical protein
LCPVPRVLSVLSATSTRISRFTRPDRSYTRVATQHS